MSTLFALLFAFDVPPRIDEPELIDDATQPYADLYASMGDVRRANRFLGGTAVVMRQARHWLRRTVPQGAHPITFLDVATGTGDVPATLVALARQVGVPVRVAGLDYSAPILRCAQTVLGIGGAEPIRLLRGDAFHLPCADASYDYVLCSLAFHHFTPTQCVLALREMERVARRGWLVNDLRRARSAWWLIRVVMALVGANRLTRHDAPASVLRAYTPEEFIALGAELGLEHGRDYVLRRSLFYRMALIRDKARQA
jgi:SAM-dependent methyltransferase